MCDLKELPRNTIDRLTINSNDFSKPVVIKKQKPGWEKEFLDEREAYKKLQELQGTRIPRYLGQDHFGGEPALYLSMIEGINLYELACNKEVNINEDMLENELHNAIDALSKHGAEIGDLRLDNFMFCNGMIMVIDFEDVEFHEGYDKNKLNQGAVSNLLSQFRDARFPGRSPSPVKFWLKDGLLSAI
jgi:RIO-like serine/threonine protein kinase